MKNYVKQHIEQGSYGENPAIDGIYSFVNTHGWEDRLVHSSMIFSHRATDYTEETFDEGFHSHEYYEVVFYISGKVEYVCENDVFKPMLKQACQNLTLETTKATFWEAVRLYPEHVSKWEPKPDFKIAWWYGEKEMNMKKAVKHLKRAFPNIDIHPFKGLGHGEIMAHKDLLLKEIKNFINEQ